MMYLLDSNACIVYLRNRPSLVRRKMEQLQTQDIVLCVIVLAELYEGAYRSKQQDENLNKINSFIQPYSILPFDTTTAVIAGQEGAKLAARGLPIGPHDLQIAAIALAHDLTLVTHNTREFSRVAGLRLEDWEHAEEHQ